MYTRMSHVIKNQTSNILQNNLNYAICIRREPGYCSVTFTNGGTAGQVYPFQLVNSLSS